MSFMKLLCSKIGLLSQPYKLNSPNSKTAHI